MRAFAAVAATAAALAGLAGTVGTGAPALAATPRAAAADPAHLDAWWYDGMGLADAHELTDGGEGATIALFDSYLDTTVPDLQGADITVRKGCQDTDTPKVRGAEADHGTAMATALVGQGTGNGEGGKGILGVAPRAKLDFYSVEAVHDDGKIDCSGFYVGEMMVEAAERGADVISFSMSGGLFGGMEEEMKRATDLGAVIVASAGDSRRLGVVDIPAQVPGVVSIGAGDENATVWEFNPEAVPNVDADIDLIAPGVATPIGGFAGDSDRWVSGGVRTGTSGATALAAGAFALAAAAYPDATANQRIQAAVHGAREDGELEWAEKTGWGALRLDRMLAQDPAGWPDENPLELAPADVKKTFPASSYAEPGDEADADDGGGASDEASASADAASEQSTASSSDDAGGPPMAAMAVGGGLGLALLLGVVLLARRRRGATSG